MKNFFSTLKKIFLYTIIILVACELAACIHFICVDMKNGEFFFPYSIRAYTIEETMDMAKNCNLGYLFGKQYNKKPIIVFGSSYISNSEVEMSDRFCSFLSEYTKRPVYDMGSDNFSLKNIYYMISQKDFFEKYIEREPDTVIIFYQPGFAAVYYYSLFNGLSYKNTENGLVMLPEWTIYLNKSYFLRLLINIYSWVRSRNFPVAFNDMFPYFIEIKKSLSSQWKDAKFIIIKYTDKFDVDNPEKWKELEKVGYQIIEISDILGDDYKINGENIISSTNLHPTITVWKNVIPSIAKKGYLIENE